MSSMMISSPSEIGKTVIWSAVANSSRAIAPLMPLAILRGTLDRIADYAAGTRTLLGGRAVTEQERGLLQLMENAKTLDEYQTAAETLDIVQGHTEWKSERASRESEYNPSILEKQMKAMNYARSTRDLGAMQHLIRTNLSRELGGMNMESMYKHSWTGTKVLIEDYMSSVLDMIEQFAESAVEFKLATSEIQFYQQSLIDSLKYFGRSALLLSGGAILGLKHIGVVKTLWEADLLPDIISGASAGSIVAAMICVSNEEELRKLIRAFPVTNLACFDPPGTTSLGWWVERFTTFATTGSFFSMGAMERVLSEWVGDLTFQEANNKTRRVLNICVSSRENGEPRILNHVTAPDVLIWSAVCASCSVPGGFPSANIYERDPVTKEVRVWMQHATQLFVDGSLDHDIPVRKLSEMFNVNFFIVSQVNPHVRLCLDSEDEFVGRNTPRRGLVGDIFSHTKHFLKRELIHRAQQATNLGIPEAYMRWASLFSQQYTGDINIYPKIQWEEYTYMLANPALNFMGRALRDGERATWSKMYRIKNSVAIELALLRAIRKLRERIYFGPEARAARKSTGYGGKPRINSTKSQRPSFVRRQTLVINLPDDSGSKQAIAPPTPAVLADLRRINSLDTFPERFSLSAIANSVRRLSSQADNDLNRFRDMLKFSSYFPFTNEEAIEG